MYRNIDSTRLINLKVVAKLKVGDKLSTRLHRFSIDEPSYSPKFILRWLNQESRFQTMDSLDSLISSCVNQNGLSDGESRILAEQLHKAGIGIKNLATTYNDDTTIVASIELIIEKINAFSVPFGNSKIVIDDTQID